MRPKRTHCQDCGQELLPAELGRCRKCKNVYAEKCRQVRLLKAQQSTEPVLCVKCGNPLSRERLQVDYRRCTSCSSAYSKKYFKDNQQTIQKKTRKYFKDNPDKAVEYTRRWRKNNPEKSAATAKKWRESHPIEFKLLTQKRRYPKSQKCADYLTAQKVLDKIAYYGNKCVYCGGPYEHIDHVIPLSKNGDHWPANLRPSCASCNMSKGNKSLKEWQVYQSVKGPSGKKKRNLRNLTTQH